MKNIKELLIKYSNFGLKEKEQKEKIIAIFEKYRINLDKKEFEIKDRVLKIKKYGPQKTEIILNKAKILKEFKGELLDIN